MLNLPDSLLNSLEGLPGYTREEFVRVHEDPAENTSVRINPFKVQSLQRELFSAAEEPSSITRERVPWTAFGYYLSQRPPFTFDPLFHAGCYYVQEASSMFLEQALKQLTDLSQPLKILDLCAAPGGKSTHLLSLISNESLLVSNEVIRSRSTILVDNIIKWGKSNVLVSNNDPKTFGQLTGYFDVLVVDAPCSGSGLFRKDEEAVNEWSPANVSLCTQRQQRILADALPSLKENGLLIYSTCSYSKEEDEDIAGWLLKEFGLDPVQLKIPEEWNIIETSVGTSGKGYRFYPYKVKGEGFFLCCFRKTTAEKEPRYNVIKIDKATAKEKELADIFLEDNGQVLIKEAGYVMAVPHFMEKEYSFLKTILNLRYAGTRLGEIMKNKLVPDHALALSTNCSSGLPFTELSYKDAIIYLQKMDLDLHPTQTGWQVVKYGNHNLGWINALPNRINNYYPKELRIRSQRNNRFDR